MHIGRRIAPVLAVALIAACGEAKSPLNPTVTSRAPALADRNAAPNNTCQFGSLTNLVNKYFPSAEAFVVKTMVGNMQKAKAGTTTAQSIGFDILVHVANNVTAGNTDVTDGGALVNGLIACMYTNAADQPLTFPEDFSVALDPNQHGAFAIRGGANDPTDPVVNRP